MSDSLKDQLMKLGFKAPPREERRPADEPRRGGEERSQGRRPGRPAAKPGAGDNHRKPQRDAGSKREDIDLAKAYAIRPRTLHLSEDFRESALAFVEKRKPVYKGR